MLPAHLNGRAAPVYSMVSKSDGNSTSGLFERQASPPPPSGRHCTQEVDVIMVRCDGTAAGVNYFRHDMVQCWPPTAGAPRPSWHKHRRGQGNRREPQAVVLRQGRADAQQCQTKNDGSTGWRCLGQGLACAQEGGGGYSTSFGLSYTGLRPPASVLWTYVLPDSEPHSGGPQQPPGCQNPLDRLNHMHIGLVDCAVLPRAGIPRKPRPSSGRGGRRDPQQSGNANLPRERTTGDKGHSRPSNPVRGLMPSPPAPE